MTIAKMARDSMVDTVRRAAELVMQYLASYRRVAIQCRKCTNANYCRNCIVDADTGEGRISIQCGNGYIIDIVAYVDDVQSAIRRMFDQPSEHNSCYAMYRRGISRHPLYIEDRRVCIDRIGCVERRDEYVNMLFNLAERVSCIGNVDDDTL
jgi:hypothetical protein